MSDTTAGAAAPRPSAREKRAAPRIPVALPALIGTYDGQHSARIHNLSRGGALIEAAVPLRTGSQIRFNCGTIETHGTIVWNDSNCFGVKFRMPVEETRIAQQVARSEAAAKIHAARRATQAQAS